MPPDRNNPLQKELVELFTKFHTENQRAIEGLRQVLLDLNERLVVAEQTNKYAEQFRLHLLGEVGKVGEKVESLRTLPDRMAQLSKEVTQLTSTVSEHDDVFLQFKGGWVVARFAWISVAAVVSLVVTLLANWFIKRGP